MSQTMNQKAATKNKKLTKAPVVEDHEDLTWGEKLLHAIKPHLSTIALVVVAGILGFIAIAFFMRNRFNERAYEWRELNSSLAIAGRTDDPAALSLVSEENPDTTAGLWAAQLAGDLQLRKGLAMLASQPEDGLALVRKAKQSFETILDAPDSEKTTMLQRRSHFSLAYAHESLGEFAEAKTLYQELIDQAPDSAFASDAKRGVARCSNPALADLYEKFTSWEKVEEVEVGPAPGPPIGNSIPNIDFGGTDLPPGETPPSATPAEDDPAAPDKTGEAKSAEPADKKAGDESKPEQKPSEPASETNPDEKQTKPDETPAEPKTGEPKTGEPKTGEPETGEPKTGEPKTGEPKTGEPKTGEPKSDGDDLPL